MIIAVLAATDKFFNYLRLHKDVLYLSAAQIKKLRELLPLFYIVLLVLALLEMSRWDDEFCAIIHSSSDVFSV